MTVRLTAKQLQQVIKDLVGDNPDEDDLESEICFSYMEERTLLDGEKRPAGIYYYLAEYPEEGVFGPIGDQIS